jgi:putative N6-adenine-specific DNA methylase
VEEFSSSGKYGCIITNPPYGERMGRRDEVAGLYRNMGAVFRRLDSWSFFILTASESFEKYYGRKADRNRKLYNGNMKTYLYQYLGPLPPRNHETEK